MAHMIIGYTRVSTAGQVQDGSGLEVQAERIRAWCQYQGLTLTGIETDAGISGAGEGRLDRAAFRSAIRRVLEGASSGSVLIVYKLDRLGRNSLDVQSNLEVLLDAGVRVVSLADGVDSASGLGSTVLKLLTTILAAFAELERDTIKTRLQGGRQHARSNGRAYTREPSYGFGHSRPDPNGKKALVPAADELRAVERIRELRAEGFSVRAIGDLLLAEGFKPRRAPAWSPAVIHRLATGRRKPPKSKGSSAARIAAARAAFLEG